MLPKDKFLEFLFVPLTQGGKDKIIRLIEKEPILNLISKMIRVGKRSDLRTIRKELELVVQLKNTGTVEKISDVIQKSTSKYTKEYADMLGHLS